MKNLIVIAAVVAFVLAVGFFGEVKTPPAPPGVSNPGSSTSTAVLEMRTAPAPSGATASSYNPSDSVLASAFANRQSNVQVQGSGQVVRMLADDNEGSRHQRFILQLASGQTLLIAHNIDLAPRLASLNTGDYVEFFGVYEWKPEGGVVHWTHHDPQGRHVPGWLKHRGMMYQ